MSINQMTVLSSETLAMRLRIDVFLCDFFMLLSANDTCTQVMVIAIYTFVICSSWFLVHGSLWLTIASLSDIYLYVSIALKF